MRNVRHLLRPLAAVCAAAAVVSWLACSGDWAGRGPGSGDMGGEKRLFSESGRDKGRTGEMEDAKKSDPAQGIGLQKGLQRLLVGARIFLEAEDRICEAAAAGDGSAELLAPEEFIEQVLGISVLRYPDSTIVLCRGDTCVVLENSGRRMAMGLEKVSPETKPFTEDGILYVPLTAVCRGFGYELSVRPGDVRVCLEKGGSCKSRKLPRSYDYRKTGRSTKVRNQGSYGTCWSFASLSALETALLPEISGEFSADHMSLHNSFSLDQKDGGEFAMSMAYLLAWQGPVTEEEDPYGDGVSPDGLKPAVHVQEIQILPSRDFKAIKQAVFLYGGVQSSLYTSLTGSDSRSAFYNEENSSYCYQGDEIFNHDVVIVGWDDEYPKENFQMVPEGDGAFLCVSSWGEEFGDDGYFYVSYYDSNIGRNGLVYTGIEPPDNYDSIYQSDLCGWVGQVGYGEETAYGAAVYEAEKGEFLRAAGFYATGDGTSYEISVVHHMEGEESLQNRKKVAGGTVPYSGFYTVPLREPEWLEEGERFALVLKVSTPETVHPIAVEYQADDATAAVDVTDGESYISLDGSRWEPLEERYQCNLCLKGYGDASPESRKNIWIR